MTSEKGVLQVGDGRGFHVGDFVLTAAHCLPPLPPPFHGIEELTCKKLIGRLNQEPTVTAELAFADPVSDLAILCEPKHPDLFCECRAYRELLEAADSFTIAGVDVEVDEEFAAKVLLLNRNDWVTGVAKLHYCGAWLLLKEPITVGGMSGSPVLDDKDNAIGVVTSGIEGGGAAAEGWSSNCRLMHSLPRWFPVSG